MYTPMMTYFCGLAMLSGISASFSSVAPAPIVLSSDIEMLVVKVNKGRCELYSASTGGFRRSFGSNIVQASVSGDNVAAVNQKGRVEIYRASTGSFLRSFGNNAVSAQVQGDEVAVSTTKGRVEIYRTSTGGFQRSF